MQGERGGRGTERPGTYTKASLNEFAPPWLTEQTTLPACRTAADFGDSSKEDEVDLDSWVEGLEGVANSEEDFSLAVF
jgi:hypothetical protein